MEAGFVALVSHPMGAVMENDMAIAAVRRGERCETTTTIRGLKPEDADSWKCRHRWRTVACDLTDDVVECQDCGHQQLARCNFEDECR